VSNAYFRTLIFITFNCICGSQNSKILTLQFSCLLEISLTASIFFSECFETCKYYFEISLNKGLTRVGEPKRVSAFSLVILLSW
jgi:hypothetical protein